jgi:RimJ/RimL family protein N-acetyltransferase
MTKHGRLVFDEKYRVAEWLSEKVGHVGSWGDFYAMGVEDTSGLLVAGVLINNYNGANATAHIAISKKNRLIIKLFQAVCDYAFNQCKLKRITGMVPTNEPATIEFDKHLGFVEEFVMKDGAPGADMMVLVLWPENCRWLQEV